MCSFPTWFSLTNAQFISTSKKTMKKILNYFEGELKNMLSQSIQAQ